MCIKGLPCQADSMGENVWLNAHCWCTRKKMVWQESETCWRYPSAPENWGSFKNIYKSVVSWHRLFILRSHGDFRSRCQLYSLKLETIRLWFRSSFWNPNMGRRPKNRWLIVGVVLFLSVFFSFHLQVWEFSEISSEDRHAGSSSKKKLKSLANKKSYNFPNFKSLMNHDDRTTRLLHGLHTKVHRTGDFLTYTRAVITKPGAVTWTIESWLVNSGSL